jgi:hypothetical protein
MVKHHIFVAMCRVVNFDSCAFQDNRHFVKAFAKTDVTYILYKQPTPYIFYQGQIYFNPTSGCKPMYP